MSELTKELPAIDYEKARKNRIVTSICNIFCHLCFLIAIIIVLAIDHSSCYYPIRAWLIVYAVLSIVGTICSLLLEIISKKAYLESKVFSRLYSFYYLTLVLFFITWTILGSVWVYIDDYCRQGTF